MSTNQEIATRSTESAWYVWKTITLGTCIKDADGFRRAMNDSGMRVSDWANDILGKLEFMVASEPAELNLAVVNVAELGIKDAAKLQDIYAAAKRHCLELCPNEVGPQLRLQHPNQPMGEWLIIAMEPITDSYEYWRLFGVAHDGIGQWLNSYYDVSGRLWVVPVILFRGDRAMFFESSPENLDPQQFKPSSEPHERQTPDEPEKVENLEEILRWIDEGNPNCQDL
jgi:hypothetical protein